MRPAESFISQPVRSLQTMLRVIGEDRGEPTTVIPDGIYGTQTRNAVTRFQRNTGLPVTGAADSTTWDRVTAEYPDAYTRVGPAEPLQLILNPGQVLRKGEFHPYLYLIQGMLTALSETYGLIAPPMTGILDIPTAEAIAVFQELSQLPVTGEVDKITWKNLARQYPLAVNIKYTQNRTSRQ